MSSAELASEHTKQEIEKVHEAAMNQSIIESSRAHPLVKRTHKGEEVIESFSEEIVRQQKDEEEKREMKRDMRARRPSLVSPITPAVENMGGVGDGEMASPTSALTNLQGLPTPTSATFPVSRRMFLPLVGTTHTKVAEPELDLSELIDIDLPESPKGSGMGDVVMTGLGLGGVGDVGPLQLTGGGADVGDVLDVEMHLDQPKEGNVILADFATSPPPLSAQPPAEPFAQPPQPPQPQSSFSLDLLWSKPSEPEELPIFNTGDEEPMIESPPDDGNIPLDLASHSRANDQDFDMLLADDRPGRSAVEIQKEIYEGLPVVWTGTVSRSVSSVLPEVFD